MGVGGLSFMRAAYPNHPWRPRQQGMIVIVPLTNQPPPHRSGADGYPGMAASIVGVLCWTVKQVEAWLFSLLLSAIMFSGSAVDRMA
jgi:hypothetical protein